MPGVSFTRKRLVGDVALYGLYGVVRSFIPFICLPLYTRMLSPIQYGALDIILTILALANLIILQFNVGFARYYFRERKMDRLADYLATTFTFFLWSGIVVGFGAASLGYLLAPLAITQVPQIGPSMSLMFLTLVPQTIVEYALVNMRLEHELRLFAITSIGEATTQAVLTIFLMWSLELGLVGYCMGTLLSTTLVSALLILYLPRLYSGKFNLHLMREIWSFTWPTLPGVLSFYMGQYGTRFIMLAFLSLHEIAIYALAMKIARICKLCVQSFRTAWLPIAMENVYEREGTVIYSKVLDLYAMVSVIFLATVSLLAHPVVTLMAPQEYSGAAGLVPYLAAAVLISASSAVLDIGNQIAEKTGWISVSSAIGTMVTLSIATFFTSVYGVVAVAAGFMLGSAVTVVMLYITGTCFHRIPFKWQTVGVVVFGLPLLVLLLQR